MNFVKVKSSVFIDTVKFQMSDDSMQFSATLIDDKGSICSQVESRPPYDRNEFIWKGLNSLPYGIYTLELCQGGEQMRLRMIKRI